MKVYKIMPTFYAPEAGFYKVSSDIYSVENTGVFEEVPNPKRYWWTFWRPKTILKEKLNVIIKPIHNKIIYLQKDESIDSKFQIEKISPGL